MKELLAALRATFRAFLLEAASGFSILTRQITKFVEERLEIPILSDIFQRHRRQFQPFRITVSEN